MHAFESIPMNAAAVGAQLVTAMVSGRADEWLFLRTDAGAAERARVAPSCLLIPEVGDVVLVCITHTAPHVGEVAGDAAPTVAALPCSHYVLAVLTRAQSQSATLALPGEDVRLQAASGSLTLAARRIALEGQAQVQARTAAFGVEALEAQLSVGELRASTRRMTAVTQELHLVADSVRQHLGRLVQKARDCFRTVGGVDDLRAGRVRWEVEGHAQMHAKQATMRAEGAVKIDGARVDLG